MTREELCNRVSYPNMDPVRLSLDEKLILMEIQISLLSPEDAENLESPIELFNKMWDDLQDDPFYHGYSEYSLETFWAKLEIKK